MNIRIVVRALAYLVAVLLLMMIFPILLAIYEHMIHQTADTWETCEGFLSTMVIGLVPSIPLMWMLRQSSGSILTKDCVLIVSIFWVFCPIVAAIPFYLWAQFHSASDPTHTFLSFASCYFEATSGLTTTGASVLSDIEALPRPILLWRALIQWLGGLGIVVFFVAVLPSLVKDGRANLFIFEGSGMSQKGDFKNVQQAAMGLLLTYVGLTVAQIVLMLVVDRDLTWFVAVTTALSTTATSGFSIFNQSSGTLSVPSQWICILFMFLCGVNFDMYLRLGRGQFRKVFKDQELQAYVAVLLLASLLVFLSIYGRSYSSMAGAVQVADGPRAFLDSIFQVVSIQTTTGFSNADSNGFPLFAKMMLCTLMIIGGCSGSTAGGAKVFRVVAVIRLFLIEIEKKYRPSVVRPVLISGVQQTSAMEKTLSLYFVSLLVVGVLSTLGVAFLESSQDLDFETVVTAVLACLNNVGPGFSMVGVTQNYSFFSAPSKLVLSLDMIIGRLEVFTILAVFLPKFWRRTA